MKIDDLKPAKNSKSKPVRVGRGDGSGIGKTSGKGHKGQKSRSGGTKGPYFEGGQMPLQRRLPKRGFKNYPFKKIFEIINLSTITKLGLSDVTPEILLAKRIIKKLNSGLKVLGNGELKDKVNIKAHAFSKSAIEKIKAVGGTYEIIKEEKTQK
ncbi:MAG: 50S ribosomal protein L15 [Thermodesulfovibrionales bacterium]|nr:50S ribosomal protein L15 [Thermodesulfovibrionales bacterium]